MGGFIWLDWYSLVIYLALLVGGLWLYFRRKTIAQIRAEEERAARERWQKANSLSEQFDEVMQKKAEELVRREIHNILSRGGTLFGESAAFYKPVDNGGAKPV